MCIAIRKRAFFVRSVPSQGLQGCIGAVVRMLKVGGDAKKNMTLNTFMLGERLKIRRAAKKRVKRLGGKEGE